tara:strand:+ start:177 stop:326 length:150 start_codon:yes stop_codon:yes gene_type:complete
VIPVQLVLLEPKVTRATREKPVRPELKEFKEIKVKLEKKEILVLKESKV